MNVPRREIGRPSLAVKAFGITDTGRVHPSNEDQFLIADLTKTMRIWHTSLPEPKTQFGDEHGHLFLVADGMDEGTALANRRVPLPSSPSSRRTHPRRIDRAS